jgi:hypothetical protein
VLARGARPVIPPRKGAAIRPPPRLKHPPPTRGAAVARIAEIGRKAWKQETGYHRRSLAETAMSRYKALIGASLKARTLANQRAEAAVAVRCLNRFTALGMPKAGFTFQVRHRGWRRRLRSAFGSGGIFAALR